VCGDTYLNTLNVSGSTILNSLDVNDVKVNNDLNIDGVTTTNVLVGNDVVVTDNALINDLVVTGSSLLNILEVTGQTTLNTLTVNAAVIGDGLVKYEDDYSGDFDDRTLVDKEYVDTLPLTYYNTTSAGTVTTTSTAYVLQTGMILNDVPAGTYLFNYGSYVNHNTNNGQIFTQIYVGGTAQTGSEMEWQRGNRSTTATHNYAGFIITLNDTTNVEIRWRTNGGTATSTNRYLTLLKVSSIT